MITEHPTNSDIGGTLYIGDILDVREKSIADLDVDHVVTVCQDEVRDNISDDLAYDHFCMADGIERGQNAGDSSYEMFKDASLRVANLLLEGNDILVHCHAGQSRSVTVSASAIALTDDISFAYALDRIEQKRGIAPSPELKSHAIRVVGKNSIEVDK